MGCSHFTSYLFESLKGYSGTDATKLQEGRVWLVEPSDYMEIYSLLALMGFVLLFCSFFGGEKNNNKINPKGNCM